MLDCTWDRHPFWFLSWRALRPHSHSPSGRRIDSCHSSPGRSPDRCSLTRSAAHCRSTRTFSRWNWALLCLLDCEYDWPRCSTWNHPCWWETRLWPPCCRVDRAHRTRSAFVVSRSSARSTSICWPDRHPCPSFRPFASAWPVRRVSECCDLECNRLEFWNYKHKWQFHHLLTFHRLLPFWVLPNRLNQESSLKFQNLKCLKAVWANFFEIREKNQNKLFNFFVKIEPLSSNSIAFSLYRIACSGTHTKIASSVKIISPNLWYRLWGEFAAACF